MKTLSERLIWSVTNLDRTFWKMMQLNETRRMDHIRVAATNRSIIIIIPSIQRRRTTTGATRTKMSLTIATTATVNVITDG